MPISPGYLSQEQLKVVNSPIASRLFLSGPAGTGKTTAAVERLLALLEHGIQGEKILVMVPQRSLAAPFFDLLYSGAPPPTSSVNTATMGGLARRMIDIFWPMIVEKAGFSHPNRLPTFLTLETAQYFLAHIIQPLLQEGYFDSITIDRNRLFSQILDSLNKSAVNHFPHTEIGERLKSAWIGDPAQNHVYDDVQECVNSFRQYCLENNLLDFSLQIDIFVNILWNMPVFRTYLENAFDYLIFDNLEEETQVSIELLQDWIPSFKSVLLIHDSHGGYRHFLGADPNYASSLVATCDSKIGFTESFINSPGISYWGATISSILNPNIKHGFSIKEQLINPLDSVVFPTPSIRLYPEMLDWIVEQTKYLIENGTSPGAISILSPYFSDALLFSLVDRFKQIGISTRSHRPSRSLREEPATRCLLTLSKIAHPEWGLKVSTSDLVHSILHSIDGMDLIRASLLCQNSYRDGNLIPFEDLSPELRERVSYTLGDRYDIIQKWLSEYRKYPPTDLELFISRIFNEILGQEGFRFHSDYNACMVVSNLAESFRKFFQITGNVLSSEDISISIEFIKMLESGVIASQYLLPWHDQPEDAVFMAPAFTFLMSNRTVDYQFWLDVGSRGWYERLYQPLTHPYVLNRNWPKGRPWTDVDEIEAGRNVMYALATGLLRRCRYGIYLGLSDLGEQGSEHKGELLQAIDRVFRSAEK